jgi:hypothetical protein
MRTLRSIIRTLQHVHAVNSRWPRAPAHTHPGRGAAAAVAQQRGRKPGLRAGHAVACVLCWQGPTRCMPAGVCGCMQLAQALSITCRPSESEERAVPLFAGTQWTTPGDPPRWLAVPRSSAFLNPAAGARAGLPAPTQRRLTTLLNVRQRRREAAGERGAGPGDADADKKHMRFRSGKPSPTPCDTSYQTRHVRRRISTSGASARQP